MGVAGLNVNTIVDFEYNEKSYKSTVQEITDKYIALSLPMYNGEYVIPHTDEEVVISYFSESDVYNFYSIVIGRKKDNIPLILISIPAKVRKIQRRNYVRIPVTIETKCWKAENNKKISLEQIIKRDKEAVKATILDISGGGSKVIVNTEAKMNEKFVLEIPLEGNFIVILGKVMRVAQDELKRNVVGLNFEDVNEKTRDELIKFIFKVMRRQMKKM